MRKRRHHFRPNCDRLELRTLLSGYSGASQRGYTPSQITSTYGLNAITFTSPSGSTVKGDGTGETIALIEVYSDPNLQSDLQTFDARYGLPNPALTVTNLAGSATDQSWSVEQSLDVEWAHAIAPGASILVVEAAPAASQSPELQNLLTAVNVARTTPGVVAVSMSWGFTEMPNESSDDSYFTTPAGYAGITFIAASGDDGVVEYPAASPYVLSVGGTTLILDSSGAYGTESAWSGSGGGYSLYEPEPGYQEAVQQSGMRSTPDVAFAGDPNTGVEVYTTAPGFTQGSWEVVGGTSLGAPAWAGIIAIVDQGRALHGLSSLDGTSQTLPSLYVAPSTDFNSVAAAQSGTEFPIGGFAPFAGSSYSLGNGLGVTNSPGGTASTGATANTATGLGSPIGTAIISDLVNTTLTMPFTTSLASASAPKPAKKHHKHHTNATSRSKTHKAKVHERKLARQENHAATHHDGVHDKKRS